MRKESILKRKIARAYRNADNIAYSLEKGFPKDTFFGYASLEDMQKVYLQVYRKYYGDTLRNLRCS